MATRYRVRPTQYDKGMLHAVYRILHATVIGFIDDKGSRLGASLAFYTAMSIAPLLMVAVGIAGMVYGPEAARGEVAHHLDNLVGQENAKTVQNLLAGSKSKSGGLLSTIVGLTTLLVAATGVFAQLQDALNTIWNVAPHEEGKGILKFLRKRLIAFALVCFLGLLLLLSLAFSAVMGMLGHWLEANLSDGAWTAMLWNQGLSFVLACVLFLIVFKLLPAVRVAWFDCIVGAVTTAVLFGIGKYAIGLYLSKMAVTSTFGAAGSFVALLLWLYYSSMIVLFGAEFTQVFSKWRRSPA